jgi:opacity protein-like surface antigen
MTRFVLVAAAALALAGTAAAQDWQELEVEGFTLRWATQSASELAVELTGPTTGWVAVGFDPVAQMSEANLIIGYVESGTAYLRDDYGVAATSHAPDTALGGTDDVTINGGDETGGETTIEFTIPLDSGDSYDKPLSPGNSYPVILARGPDGADDFSTYHEFVTATTIEIWALDFDSETWGGLKALP